MNTDLSPSVSRLAEKIGARPWLAFAAIALFSWPLFFFLNGWSFTDPDEGRYATIPLQMLTRGDWVTPTHNEVNFFDKPPLLYWAIAGSYSAFGAQEWAARLVPALAALAALFAAFGLGRRMFGARAGIIGAVVLATSLMWPLLARVVVTDMLVSSLLFVALALWWMAHSETVRRKQTGYFIAFWIAMALGMLAKGPVVFVLVGGCLFLYALVCKQWRALPQMRWIMGVPLLVAIAAPWFVLMAQRNPEFNHYFWYDQHIGRFLGKTTGNDHTENAVFYFKFLPLIVFPWSIFAPAAILAGWNNLRASRGNFSEKQRAAIFLLCGVAFILLFFSASSGKLLTYILPIVPMLALLIAAYFDWIAQHSNWNRALGIATAVLATVLAIGGAAIVAAAPRELAKVGANGSNAIAVGLVLLAWAMALVFCARRLRLGGLIAATAGGFTVFFVVLLSVVATVIPRFTTESLVDVIRPGLTPRAEVVTIDYIRSISLYVGRRVRVVGTHDEMKVGVDNMPLQERRAWFYEGADAMKNLRLTMKAPHAVYGFMRVRKSERKEVQDLMRELGNGVAPIAANERYLVFGNRAALATTPSQMNGR